MDQIQFDAYDSVTIVVDQGPDGDHIVNLLLQQLKTLCPQKKVEVQKIPLIRKRNGPGKLRRSSTY